MPGTSLIDALDFAAHRSRDGDRVLARLLLHLNLHARLAVDQHERPALLGGVLHFGDVAHVDGHGVPRHHDDVANVLEALELTLAADQEGGVALVDLAKGCVLVLVAQRVDDVGHREVERRDLLFRQLDVDLPADAAVDRHGGDAVDALEARRDLVLRDLAERDGVVVALDADLRDRQLVRVELEDRWRISILRETAAHAINAGPHFVGRLRQVRAPLEVQLHPAVAFGRFRRDPHDAGHGADCLLERPGDQLLDLERADARVTGADVQRRLLELGHEIDWQPGEGDQPEQRDDCADHEHRDGTLNR